ncbi:autotransporter outer membrane beta-barrel domain-containing protein [Caulobacter hibisci]|uniref:Autotransporter outer membrane beta-barrel domain-containing protein n=1 Tax=Caulobacter hibisci TaxID=2035993 RepID=A0ABS0STZ3_9CAUL|nr:autotransporter outer membrane beta-barrel domain-containing protein [Caulobacter hibisci]MBI1682117.1 autotransporter outer membrane beta-barrel domain-containing protein [Caulobacter hibisci]
MSRKLLILSAAALPMLLHAGGAVAETEITSSSRTKAVATSTANDGAADDVKITSDGVITYSSSGAIATVDSSNTLTNNGSLTSTDISDSTGILINAGVTSTVTNGGTISLVEDYDYEDTDSDGDYDGQFALGTNRYGIRLAGSGDFTGTIENSGSITIEGNDSIGIILESSVIGDILNSGSIAVTGDDSYGLRNTAKVTGNIVSDGSISVTGAGSVGLAVNGEVEGSVIVQGSISATGYRYTSRYTDPDDEALLDADDLLQGGSAIQVSSNVSQGLVLDAPPEDTNDDTTDDEDGDDVTDSDEGTASVLVYGGAPAIQIGSDSQTVTLGSAGEGIYDYGLVIRGSVAAYGIHPGVAATGVQIGGSAGYETLVTNGINLEGSIAASAYEADAVGLRLTSGAIARILDNSGSLSSSVTAEGESNAYALLIDAGATMTTVNNSGGIVAYLYGESGDANAIVDRSGTLTTINNTGTIAAYVAATDDDYDLDDSNDDADDEVMTGKAVAINLQANTTGVTITQTGVNDGDDGDDDVADTDTDGDGVDDADEPSIVGQVLLGSGADTLNLLNGTLYGEISFGDGADVFNIDGGAYAFTKISDSDGLLSINVGDGGLLLANTDTIKATSLTLGADASLVFTVDPSAGTATQLVVDTATIASGANLGLVFNNLLTTASTFKVISAGSLTIGDIDQDLLGDAPYLYVANAYSQDNDVLIDVRRRTATEAGMTRGQASAYDAVFAALSANDDIAGAFLSQSSRDGFYNLYNQMLPSTGAGIFTALQTVQQQASAATALRPDGKDRYGPDSVWVQEINALVRIEDGENLGSDTKAMGFVAGYEAMGDAGGALGVTLAFVNLEEEDTVAKVGEETTASLFQAGTYWRRSIGGWRLNLGGGAGYIRFNGDRSFISEDVDGDDVADVMVSNTAAWNGFTANAFAGVGYEAKFGRNYIRPETRLDYVYLWEGARKEHGGGEGFDQTVAARKFSNLSGDIGVAFGREFGTDVWVRPEVRIGYRKTLAGKYADTTASFSGGTPFTILANNATAGAVTLNVALRAGSDLSYFALEGGAEASRRQTRYTARLSGRAMF